MRGETGNGKPILRVNGRLYNLVAGTFQTGRSNKMQQRDAMCHVRTYPGSLAGS